MKVTAQQIVCELVEELGAPFAKAKTVLQYRPFLLNGDWKWFWVLLPADRSKALATGQSDSRAEAATAARQEARKLGVVIDKIDVMMPYSKQV